ncbi:hypothetical protein GCM10017786_46790 [Amycolatopsis deserti]|uniref:Uncharacterized protein n=1 Tax=Amycolatopsis deserti TaxID=185696 RepID=A0ABQ3J9Z9_9PSEU|nr:DUF6226 family protein [Amycolatopsis deserti]GHF07744.1 hypothetical protein GCM10017786_46790 [Amycolatopsis deserti]
MTPEELRARVAERYARLDVPAWPDPHADTDSPRDDEYSRVTDPGRYRVTHARGRAWAGVLGDLPGVSVETLAPAPLDDQGELGRFDRGVRISSSRPGTLPLLLLEQDAPLSGAAGTIAVLHISVARPGIALAAHPDCGCDACDQGSDDLLEAIDQEVATALGPLVVLHGHGWNAQWHPGGSRSTGIDHDRAIDLCRRLAEGARVPLPAGTEVHVGRSWLS